MKLEPSRLRLYAVTDRSWLNGGRLVDAVAAALDGGATFVQLREKALDPADILAEARQLAALCHRDHLRVRRGEIGPIILLYYLRYGGEVEF